MTDWHGQRWEYHVHRIEIDAGGALTDGALDSFGAWGWELVTVTPLASPAGHQLVYTFKRLISQAKIELP